MNTADRSVEALDTALRRRFCFEEMMPMSELLSPSALYCKLLWDYETVDWDHPEFKEKEEQFFNFTQVSEDFKVQRKGIWETMKVDYIRDDFSYFEDFDYTGCNLQAILEKINNRIEVLLNRDHLIGHSYFLNVRTEEQLKATFKNNIIPLLQEYFYGDYEKIGLIIGSGFFEKAEKFSKELFASFDTQNHPDNGTILRIKTIDEDFDIIAAVNLLLNV
jgi:5-methylcytosine-specific restriction endonuclease McrBC GTP-binding regulatory subunit McrB